MSIRVNLLMALFLLASQPLSLLADDTYRVFDKKGNVTEIWKEKDGLIEVYNPDMSRKGYIKKEGHRLERYDKDWRREGTIRKETHPSEENSQPRK
ncbi:MAG: hypothetical protein HY893_07510 [Deltaproteobacteria bacterium]|nr:hypothetical protein [Deltaproteobacteria bacterium]